MIKVLHYGLTSSLGGIETYLNKLYKNIDKVNIKFDFLIIGDKKPCYYDEFKSMGSNFHFITPRTKNSFKNRNEINDILKKEQYDIVHCHLNTLSYVTPIYAALKNNCKVIVHSRNGNSPKSYVTKILHYYNYFRLPKNKLEKLAVSDIAGEWLFGKNENYTIINNGLDIDKYSFELIKRNNKRKELNINNEFVVLNIGALRPQKNHMFILEVFKQVVNKRKDARLLLVGDGKEKDNIRKRITELKLDDYVYLLGNRSDISELLCAADVFLFPSFYEGFPNAVIEAETSGLPCLISDTITDEVIINPNCIALPLMSDADFWANQLLKVEHFSDRKNAAIRIKDKGFSVKDEVKKIESIYGKLKSKVTS